MASDDLPAYLRNRPVTPGRKLKGFDITDLADNDKGKPMKEDPRTTLDALIMPRVIGERTASKIPEPRWVLEGEPRQVQLEALRRAYYGVALYDEKDGEPVPRIIRKGDRLPARGYGLFMEQRLGKTPAALNEFGLLMEDYGFEVMIVLAPNSFKKDWPLEAERFGLKVNGHAFVSTERDKASAFASKHQKRLLISVNYEALADERTMSFLEGLTGRTTAIYADESIWIKNPNGAYTRPAIELAKRCAIRRPLTGKPTTQGAHDLYAQLRFAGHLNGFLYEPFKTTFCKKGGFQGKQVVGVKEEALPQLHEILDTTSFIARRNKWMTTPGREYATVNVEMIREQKVHYDRMNKDFITELMDGTIVTADQIVTKLIKLQQISSGFIIDEFGTAHEIMPPRVNPKLQTLKSMLLEQIEQKAIVFVHHTHSADLIEKELASLNPCVIRGAGWHSSTKRDILEEKRRFNNDPNARVMIGQIQAIRYGHTLMGTPSDPCVYEFWYENNYSLNDRSQGEERPQGAGQTQPITIYDMVASPQDQAVIDALQGKEDVSAAVLGYLRSTGVLPYTPPGLAGVAG